MLVTNHTNYHQKATDEMSADHRRVRGHGHGQRTPKHFPKCTRDTTNTGPEKKRENFIRTYVFLASGVGYVEGFNY